MGTMTFRPGQRLVIPGVQVWTPGTTSAAFTGVLDGISNVAAAYGLRKLRSAYSGSAVCVRRSSDSTEQDIGFASDGEFDSAAFSSFVGGGTGYVKTWYDQSGNSRDATQATTGSQPQITLSVTNSKAGIQFGNGGNKFLDSAAFSGLSMPNTAFVAHKSNSGSAGGFLGTTSGTHALWNGTVTYQLIGGSAASPATLTPPSGNPEIITAVWSTTNTQFHINGGSDRMTDNVGSASLDSIRIGRYTSFYLAGYMFDIIVITGVISTTDHNTIGSNMATRYGLSWTTVT